MQRLHVILDQSGSMSSINVAAYEGAKELLETVADTGTFAFTTFNTTVADTVDMTRSEAREALQPGICSGQTALYDGIGKALTNDMEKCSDLTGVTIAIVTDGLENASRTHSRDTVRQLISTAEQKSWKLYFLGAKQDAIITAGNIGISADRALTYGAETTQVRNAFRSLSAANGRHKRGEHAGFTQAERQSSINPSVVAPVSPVSKPSSAPPVISRSQPLSEKKATGAVFDTDMPFFRTAGPSAIEDSYPGS